MCISNIRIEGRNIFKDPVIIELSNLNIITGFNHIEKYLIIDILKALHIKKIYDLDISNFYTNTLIFNLNINGKEIVYRTDSGRGSLIKGDLNLIPNIQMVDEEIPQENTYNWFYKITRSEVNKTFKNKSLYGICSLLNRTLKLNEGDIVLIRNIEDDLHPDIQKEVGVYICYLISRGVKVFIETNSIHILNSIRIQIKRKVLNIKEVKLIDFNKNRKRFIQFIEIKEGGIIEDWPRGFFDRLDKDFNELFPI